MALGGAQSGQRLAGSAGHDELAAAAGLGQAGLDVPDRVFLVRSENWRRGGGNLAAFDETGPVDRALPEIVQPDAHDRNGLVGKSLPEIGGPVAPAAVDDDAPAEIPGAGIRQELVDLRSGDGFSFTVELALDRGQTFAARKLGHQVDAVWGGVLAALPGPVGMMPNVAVLKALLGVMGQEGDGEPLEGIARGSFLRKIG